MSVFGSILSKVFGHTESASAPAPAAPSAPTPAPTAAAPAAAAAEPMSQAEVEAMLAEVASHYSHEVNWRGSIVDLLAMLGIDNSLAQRKTLAQELGYSGDMNDSATMNTWLHKEVMRKLAESGGSTPPELMH